MFSLPSTAYLHTLSQLLKFHTDAKVQHELQLRIDNAKFAKYYDQKENFLRNTTAAIKGNAHPPLTVTKQAVITIASLLCYDHGLLELLCEDHRYFRIDKPITYAEHQCTLVAQEDHKLTMMIHDAEAELPSHGPVAQTQYSQSGEVIFQQLHSFWSQYWTRDTQQDQNEPERWQEFHRLVEHVPPLPPVQVDVSDLRHWQKALASTKSGTSRGYDGWHPDELKSLPDNCLQALADIFTAMPPQAILPPHLNQAITLPLSKQPDSEDASRTRPITLVPLLYRVWARVITQQILQQWIPSMPAEVIGFLPGRSPQQFLNKLQWDLERIHTIDPHNQPAFQGATLDLVKCFNLIPRQPAAYALRQAGIPDKYVTQWLETLASLSRWWKVHQSMHHSGLTTTGTPEGDSWSVLACVALTRLWIEIIRTPVTQPYAYADNLAWRTRNLDGNLQAFRQTKTFMNTIRLLIDWEKTWIWLSGATATAEWTAAIQQECHSPHPVTQVHVARELGLTLNYNKRHSRATQRDRHTSALQYIKKARQPSLSLDSRAKLCSYALSKALWGTESYVVGKSWLNELRSAIAKTLVLDKQHSNSHLACMLLSKHITDPTLYHIVQCIRACRNMVNTLSPEEQANFYRMASQHTCRHSEVWGPAGTLAYNLSRIGWKLLPTGVIDTDTQVQFHLLHSCRQHLLTYLEQAWMRHLTQCELHRPEWTHLPTPDRQATLKCYATSPASTHETTACVLAGTSMLASQIKHFGETTENCELCGEPDGYVHRALECSATADIRANHPDITHEAAALDPCFVHLPVVYDSPYADFHAFYFQHVTAPSTTPEAQSLIDLAISTTSPLQVFTDGTCDFPHIPQRRRAGFAAVIQRDLPDFQKREQIIQFRTNNTIPAANLVATLGEVPGKQHIGRAELAAIGAVAAWQCPVDLWTDSQYAQDTIALLQRTEEITLLHTRPNYDLLRPIWQHVRRSSFRVHKIKAHALDCDHDPLDVTWAKLGNEAADRAAKQFLEHLHRQHPLDLQPHEHNTQVARCHAWYAYMHDLQVARAKLFQQDAAPQPMGHARATWDDHLHLMKTWEPPNFWTFDYHQQYDSVLADCVWGSQYTDLLLQWISQVAWPVDLADQEPYNLGITWYELAVSFSMYTQSGITVNAGGQHQDFRPFQVPVNSPEVPWSTQVQSFERALNNIQQQLVDRLYPDGRTMAKGIRVLGASHAKHGLHARPRFPFQTEVCNSIQEHMSRVQADPTLTSGPEIPLCTPRTITRIFEQDRLDRETGWHLRVARTVANRRRR